MKLNISLSVIFLLSFWLSSCEVNFKLLDTKPPNIVVYSPIENRTYYNRLPIHIQVNEIYEKPKESGIQKISIKISRIDNTTYDTKIFETNIHTNANEVIVKFDFNFMFNNYGFFIINIEAIDNQGNKSTRQLAVSQSPIPILSIYLPLLPYSTNTNKFLISGRINITTEYYGEIESVKLIISNNNVSELDVDFFNEYTWYIEKELPLEPNQNNYIYASLKTINNFTNNSGPILIFYDILPPSVEIVNITNGQNLPLSTRIDIQANDNNYIYEVKLIVIPTNSSIPSIILSTNYFSYCSFIVEFPSGGEYYLIPYAKDGAGNETYGQTNLVIVNSEMPYIYVFEPINDFNTLLSNKNLITLSGKAGIGTPNKITNIKIFIENNGNTIETNLNFNSETVNFSINLNLGQGTNQINYFALSDNNKSTPTNYVNIIVDSIPPIAEIIYPTNNELFTTNIIPIITYINDTNFSSGIYGNIITSSTNITIWQNTNTNYITLDYGRNQISLIVYDFFGNSKTNTISVIFSTNIYVSVNGNDNNSGLVKNEPLKTIQKAIEKSMEININNILISIGTYTKGNGLNMNSSGVVISNKNFNLIGGWNETFENIIGKSVIDANGLNHGIFISNSGINIKNFTIINAIADGITPIDKVGGGILILSSSGELQNITISNNIAQTGAGIYILNSTDLYISNINLFNNSNTAIEITNSSKIELFNVEVNNNFNGVAIIDSQNSSIINSSFRYNKQNAIKIVNGIQNYVSNSQIVFNSNTTTSGGIIEIVSSNSIISLLNNSVISNYGKVGGIKILEKSPSSSQGKITIYGNYIALNNSTEALGGAIYGSNTTKLLIKDNILSNNTTSSESKTITIFSSFNGNWSKLELSGNKFYGIGQNPVAIWEEGEASGDIKNHTISNNIFYLSTYTNLYRDISGTTLSPTYIPSSTLGIILLNTVPNPDHDANPSTNNIYY